MAIKHTPAHARRAVPVAPRCTAFPASAVPPPHPTTAWPNEGQHLSTDGAAFERADCKKLELMRKMRPALSLRDPATGLAEDPAEHVLVEWQRAPSQVQQLRQLKEQRAAQGAKQTTRDARIDALTRELHLGTQLKGSNPVHATEARGGGRALLVGRRLDSGNVRGDAAVGCGGGSEWQQPRSMSNHPAGRDCAYVNLARVH